MAGSSKKRYPQTLNLAAGPCYLLVLCEGRDALRFLEEFFLARFPQEAHKDLILLHDWGGNEQLTQSLENITKADGFYENVRRLLVVRDSERDAIAACQSIEHSLKTADLAVPGRPLSWAMPSTDIVPRGPQTAYALFPTCDDHLEQGTLEDLAVRILSDANPEMLPAVRKYLADVEKITGVPLKWKHKSRLHSYFSATNRYVGMKIGEAAKKGAFKWDAPELAPLYRFLSDAMQEEATR